MDVRSGYTLDNFCKKIFASCQSFLLADDRDGHAVPGVTEKDGLWYIGDRLLIPHVGSCREDLFRLAHDALGHFGTDKAYASLRDAYYWPNMCHDLAQAYIPACFDCQRNKSSTAKPHGPLHPLPVPDAHGNSVALNFIGPLLKDMGFNCILSITDCSGSDIRIVPTRTNISMDELAVLFFDHWYCENGLPLNIVSDCDKLFVSAFWKALHRLWCEIENVHIVSP